MSNLETSFAGIALKNPLIAASCNRTNSVENCVALEKAGAAAIVLKSLFEENIVMQTDSYIDSNTYTEGLDYLEIYMRNHALSEYVELIRQSKAACNIPIIASINCNNKGEWVNFAELIEQAGADGLELNIMGIETSVDYVPGSFEQMHVDIVKMVRKHTKLPIIVKLGSNITNPIALIYRLKAEGVNGIVMFNRMYQTDININSFDYVPGHVLSSSSDLALPLRWVGLASGKECHVDYALSGGVHQAEDVIKSLLVGASAVEVCSVLYEQGNEWIGKALDFVDAWQKQQGYEKISEYKGKMSSKHTEGESHFTRTQFLKYFESFQK